MRPPYRTAPIACALLVLLVAGVPIAWAGIDERKATAVKAAYLRYIAEFTTWPSGAFAAEDDPIVIGTMGDDSSGVIAAMRRRIERKGLSAQRRPIVMRTLSLGSARAEETSGRFAGQLDECHVLFIGKSEGANWPRIRAMTEGRAVVTVSEIGGFSQGRGMIEFVVSQGDGRVAMHIDLDAVRDARLQLSSQLLGLKSGVKIVRGAREANFQSTHRRSSG